jgi:DNA-binding transcriptional LysR family regulator
VSIQLKNFQARFSIPLTEVIGRKLFITDFGREIAAAADEIINQVSAINYKTLAYRGQLSGRLKISVVSTGKYVMPYFLGDFMMRHEGVDLRMDVTNKTSVIESLENNEVDFSLVSIVPQVLQVDSMDLLQNKLHLIGSSSNKQYEGVQEKDIFKDLPLIFREKGSGTRQTMERFIAQENIMVQKKMELTSNEAVKQAVLAGLGYSIMPIIGIKNELKDGLLNIVNVKGLPITTTWSLIWVKGKKHSPVAKAFLKYVEEEKENIIKKWFD